MSNYLQYLRDLIFENGWIEKFLEGQGYCIICNHSDPLDLENHHIGGRQNSSITVSVCRNCHYRLSKKQLDWNKHWTQKNNKPDIKFAFLLRGFSDVLRLYSDKILLENG